MESGIVDKNAKVKEEALKCYEAGYVWQKVQMLRKHIDESSKWDSKALKPGEKERHIKRFEDFCKGCKINNVRKYLRSESPEPEDQNEESKGGFDPSRKMFDQSWCFTISDARKWTEKKKGLTDLIEDCERPNLQIDKNAVETLLKTLFADKMIKIQIDSVKAAGAISRNIKKDFKLNAIDLA